jgi:hypothetical protein
MGAISPATRRRLFGGAIVLFWLVMLGVLVHRELGGRGILARRPALARVPHAGESWLGLFVGGQRIGNIHLVTQPGEHGGRAGVTMHLDLRLRVRVLDAPAELRLAGSIWRALAGSLAAFDLRASSGGHALQVEGTVEKGLLSGVLHSGGETIPVQARVGRLLESDDALLGVMPGSGLTPGLETTFESLDPFTLRAAPARVRCVREERLRVGGEVVPTRVMEVTVGQASVTAWLDPGGTVVQAEAPFGLTLKRLGREEVLAPAGRSDAPDLLAALRVAPAGHRPQRGAHRMVARITGVPVADLPTDDTQTLAPGGSLLVVSPPLPSAASTSSGHTLPPGYLASALACNPLVQCDNAAIKAQAARIVGAERDVWARALLINAWVNANLVKKAVLSVPSALDVLASREGDCTEHTVLFTALARAAGVPTRMAAGLVWSEELQAFGYHAWPEVFAGRWTWTDPTLGQPIADATHIKLATGGIEDWRGVVAFLGRIRVEVVEIE